MISTLDVKKKLYDGFFHVGDESSKEVILMSGSCRGIPHLNFIHQWNELHGRPFLIYYINPCDYHWDKNENEQDIQKALAEVAESPVLHDLLKRTKIFIHEHFERWGVFNTDENKDHNIYHLGLKPEKDICLPNWHCRFILFQDIVRIDEKAKATAKACGGELSSEVKEDFKRRGVEAMDSWMEMCALTSFPWFADYFKDHRITKRFFFNGSHISNHFTIPVFENWSKELLGLQVSDDFIKGLYAVDMYNNYGVMPLTKYDVEAYGFQWPEPIKELQIEWTP